MPSFSLQATSDKYACLGIQNSVLATRTLDLKAIPRYNSSKLLLARLKDADTGEVPM